MLSRVVRFSAVALCVLTLGLPVTTSAQSLRLEVSVSNDYLSGGITNDTLVVTIRNPLDSVAGFVIWLQLDRPDIIKFLPGTLPAYQFDTSGATLTNGWEVIEARSLSGQPTDIKIVGLADFPGGPVVPAFGPSALSRDLIRIPFTVVPGIENVPGPHEVNIFVNTDMGEHFNFSTPNGTTIPWADTTGGVPFIDTVKIEVRPGNVYVETDGCAATTDLNMDLLTLTIADYLLFQRVYQGMIDPVNYLAMVDLNADCIVDSVDYNMFTCYWTMGLSCILPWPRATCCQPEFRQCCQGTTGNVDCDPTGNVDISDIAALIDYLYITSTPLCCWGEANVDSDPARGVDISDLSAIIDYLYISFTPLQSCQ